MQLEFDNIMLRVHRLSPTNTELEAPIVAGSMLSLKDFATLRPQKWLNDAIINERLNMLQRENGPLAAEGKSVKVHIFSTHFMNKLWLDNPGIVQVAAVERFLMPGALRRAGQFEKSIFDCQLWMVPCHLHNHWVLLVVDLSAQTITYYDALGVGYLRAWPNNHMYHFFCTA